MPPPDLTWAPIHVCAYNQAMHITTILLLIHNYIIQQ